MQPTVAARAFPSPLHHTSHFFPPSLSLLLSAIHLFTCTSSLSQDWTGNLYLTSPALVREAGIFSILSPHIFSSSSHSFTLKPELINKSFLQVHYLSFSYANCKKETTNALDTLFDLLVLRCLFSHFVVSPFVFFFSCPQDQVKVKTFLLESFWLKEAGLRSCMCFNFLIALTVEVAGWFLCFKKNSRVMRQAKRHLQLFKAEEWPSSSLQSTPRVHLWIMSALCRWCWCVTSLVCFSDDSLFYHSLLFVKMHPSFWDLALQRGMNVATERDCAGKLFTQLTVHGYSVYAEPAQRPRNSPLIGQTGSCEPRQRN